MQKFTVADTALIRAYIEKGAGFASENNDSALYYAEIGQNAAQQINNEALLARAFFLKAKIYYFIANYSAAQFYQYKSLVVAEKTKDKRLMSKSFNLAGAICFSIGNFEEALKQYNNRLIISAALKDTNAILQAYFNISLVYNAIGEYKKSVEVNYKARDLAEKTKDTINLMAVYEGLGMSYFLLDETKNSLSFLNKAFAFASIKKQEYEQGGILIDMGNVYQRMYDNPRAISYYNKAIEITIKNGDKRRQATAKANKAKSLMELKNYKQALDLCNEAIKINIEINYAKGISDAFANKSECFYEMKNYLEAEKFAIQARDVAIKIKAPKEEYNCYSLLNKIYEAQNNKEKAFLNYKKFINLRDSIDNNGEVKTISGIEFGYEKDKAARAARFAEEENESELKKQKLIGNIIFLAGAFMMLLLVFILIVYAQTQKANRKINEQNKIIEQKSESILNSINYSKNIQQAILTPDEEIKKILPDSFVLYKPKDIVSGDFYFIESVTSNGAPISAVALADCTGHGVPGALMSLMGYNILKQSLKQKEINGPGDALDYLNKELHSFLRQNQKEEHVLDGMDIAFCAIEYQKRQVVFSGANNPLWILSKNKNLCDANGNKIAINSKNEENYLYEVKATKQPIGFTENPKPFTTHVINLEKGDLLYLFTDGFADQFGGPKGKKYKYKQLSELILSSANLNLSEQKTIFENSFENWKGELEQIDDVSIVGIRI
ncbi:MAG TPA: SpoIIE family protein phosphatase [Bacteroidia bacterium]|nr:SpoIIE family protein phosphatase [Bacteroidia bacterium]